jgi:hypothetical protein
MFIAMSHGGRMTKTFIETDTLANQSSVEAAGLTGCEQAETEANCSAHAAQDSKNPRWDNASPPLTGENISNTSRRKGQPAPDTTKLLYTLKETAFMLSVSEKSVRRLLERGLLKSNPALRTKLISSASINAFAKMTT